ncbi:MAG: hypothetical protein IKV28_03435 [Bacteroidales bacterium]|nr:hypothetical protein [Bacteroidales bacterium]
MEEKHIKYDCERGCTTERTPEGSLQCQYKTGCCKLESFNWLSGIQQEDVRDIFEVRFKNTRKGFYRNASGQLLRTGDFVVVEAANGHDLGIITLDGAIVARQMMRHHYNPQTYECKKIYRKAKALDMERWQEAIAREHQTMIRARQIAAEMKLSMKIGDVEFQGDGTKAIFYYIADERVDFRQLIKVFAEEFRIRIEMKQIGARQEAALIGDIGVCGRTLCCSTHIVDFHSITTQSARCQDLSLNPQKLAGQCGKLKCCINYEAAVYQDAINQMPRVNNPLILQDGEAHLVKTDILKGLMTFSYDPHSLANTYPLPKEKVIEILKLNARGKKGPSLMNQEETHHQTEFISAVGDEKIDRFDDNKKNNKRNNPANNKPRPNNKKRKPKKGGEHGKPVKNKEE